MRTLASEGQQIPLESHHYCRIQKGFHSCMVVFSGGAVGVVGHNNWEVKFYRRTFLWDSRPTYVADMVNKGKSLTFVNYDLGILISEVVAA